MKLRPWSCLQCGARRLQRDPVCWQCQGVPDVRPWALRDGWVQSALLWVLAPFLSFDDWRQRRARRAKR